MRKGGKENLQVLEINPARLSLALETIDKQSAKLAYLINQLLEISRLEAGKLALELKITDINTLLKGVMAGITAGLDHNDKHSFYLKVEKALSAEVDAIRLEQVIINLLDNAIKYSPQGGPIIIEATKSKVEITKSAKLDVSQHDRPQEEGSSGYALQIVVKDQGIGVSPVHRPHIFDRFYRAHDQGYYSGMGMGLYISRQIIELHGGRIEVGFPDEGGTSFLVTLPLKRP